MLKNPSFCHGYFVKSAGSCLGRINKVVIWCTFMWQYTYLQLLAIVEYQQDERAIVEYQQDEQYQQDERAMESLCIHSRKAQYNPSKG